MNRQLKAFTLVEILIVVVILGILAAIVVPQFASATSDAQKATVADQVAKMRRLLPPSPMPGSTPLLTTNELVCVQHSISYQRAS